MTKTKVIAQFVSVVSAYVLALYIILIGLGGSDLFKSLILFSAAALIVFHVPEFPNISVLWGTPTSENSGGLHLSGDVVIRLQKFAAREYAEGDSDPEKAYQNGLNDGAALTAKYVLGQLKEESS